MIETEVLGICTVDDAIALFRKMILENRAADKRLADVETDDRSLRTLIMYSLDTERNLFLLVKNQGRFIGFVDSALVDDGQPKWFIKSAWLEPRMRVPEVFNEVLSRLERSVRKKGISYVFSTALPRDARANDFWTDAGYAFEGERRVKILH